MTDYIIIVLLALIWFQGTRYSRTLSNNIDWLIHAPARWLKEYRNK